MRVMAVLAAALAGLAGLGGAGTARAATAATAAAAVTAQPGSVSKAPNPIPWGGASKQAGVTFLCLDKTGFTCTEGGYKGTPAQINAGGGG